MSYTHPAQAYVQYGKAPSELPQSKNKRIFLIGPSGWGKTTSACKITQGGVVIVDMDNNLPPELAERPDIMVLPFYDDDFRKKHFQASHSMGEMLTVFTSLTGAARKFGPEITLVFDNLSVLSDDVEDRLWTLTPIAKESKEKDGYAFWDMWADWFKEFCRNIRQLSCNVVLIAHEHEIIDVKSGRIQGYRWWLPGKAFSMRLPQSFTDVIRMNRILEGKEYKYRWQVKATPEFPYCKTTMKTPEIYVDASWKSFENLPVKQTPVK